MLPFATIQHAISVSAPGDTIIANPGVYAEDLLVNVPAITIQSAVPLAATLVPVGGQVDPVYGAVTHVLVQAPAVTIDGFTMTGAAPTHEEAIMAQDSPGLTVQNCDISNYVGDAIYVFGVTAPVAGILIDSNAIHDMRLVFDPDLPYQPTCIYLDSAEGTVSGNVLTNNRVAIGIGNAVADGIANLSTPPQIIGNLIGGMANPTVAGGLVDTAGIVAYDPATITGNTIDDTNIGIDVQLDTPGSGPFDGNLLVNGNGITNLVAGPVSGSALGVTLFHAIGQAGRTAVIDNNTIAVVTSGAPTGAAIVVSDASAGTVAVTNNTITGYGTGIDLDACASPATVDGNSLDIAPGVNTGAVDSGLIIRGGSSAIVQNNAITGFDQAVEIDANGATSADLGGGGASTGGNDLSGNALGVTSLQAGTVMAENNYWGTISWAGYEAVGGIPTRFTGDIDYNPWTDSTLIPSLIEPSVVYVDQLDLGGVEEVAGSSGGVYGYDAFAVVQDGIDNVLNSTVLVAAGTYTEDIYINKPLDLIGASSATVTLAPVGVQTDPFYGGLTHILVDTADDVSISEFEIDGGLGVDEAIMAQDANNLTVASCSIHDYLADAVYVFGVTDTVTGAAISNNMIANMNTGGVDLGFPGTCVYLDSAGGAVTGNIFTNNTVAFAIGSVLEDGKTNLATPPAISGNTITAIANPTVSGAVIDTAGIVAYDPATISGNAVDATNVGIDVQLATPSSAAFDGNVQVDGNTLSNLIAGPVSGNAVGVALFHAAGQAGRAVAIDNNTIAVVASGAATGAAIVVSDASAGTVAVTNNTITGYGTGIDLDACASPATVDGNSLDIAPGVNTAAVDSGLIVRGASVAAVQNNDITGFDQAVEIDANGATSADLGGGGVSTGGNDLSGNALGVTSLQAGTVMAENNYWGTISWAGYEAVGGIPTRFTGDIDYNPWTDSTLIPSLIEPSVVYVDQLDLGGVEEVAGSSGGVYGYDAFAVVQDGIDNVLNSTVLVAAGTYTEDIYINKPLDLIGASSTTVTLLPAGVQVDPVYGASTHILVDTADDVLITEFDMNGGLAVDEGVMAQDSNNLEVSSCSIHEYLADAIYVFGVADTVTGADISNNTIANMNTGAVDLGFPGTCVYLDSAGGVVAGNTFINNTVAFAIGNILEDGKTNLVTPPAITGNTIATVNNPTVLGSVIDTAGIVAYDPATVSGNAVDDTNIGIDVQLVTPSSAAFDGNVQVDGNSITNLTAGPASGQALGVTLFKATGQAGRTAVIDNNTIAVVTSGAPTGAAIVVFDASAGTVAVTNNTITGYGTGIDLDACVSPATVDGNSLDIAPGVNTAAVDSGLLIRNGSAVAAQNNDITGFDNGVEVLASAGAGVTVNANNLAGNLVAGLDNQNAGVTIDATANWWGSYAGPGALDGGGRTGDAALGLVTTTPYVYGEYGVNSDADAFTDDALNDIDDDNDTWGDIVEVMQGSDPLSNASVPAGAAVVWVDDNWTGSLPGDPVAGHTYGYDAFDTIQEGLDKVAAAGTVNVNLGAYAEALVVPKAVTLIGERSAGLGALGYDIPVLDNGGVGDALRVQGGITGVTIRYLSIQNYNRGLAVDTTSEADIRHCDITGIATDGVLCQNVGYTVDATDCWWGDASGPGGAGPGAGTAISANVDGSGFWATPVEQFPTVESVTLTAATTPTNALIVTYDVAFSQAVTPVVVADFALAPTFPGASIQTVTGADRDWVVTVGTAAADGLLSVDVVDAGTVGSDFLGYPLGGVGVGNGDYTTGETHLVDSTDPTSVVDAPSGVTSDTVVTVSWTPADPLANGVASGVQRVGVWWQKDGLAATGFLGFNSPQIRTSLLFDSVGLGAGDGIYGFYARARDNALNEEALVPIADTTVLIDSRPPISSLTNLVASANGSTMDITYTSADDTVQSPNVSGAASVALWYFRAGGPAQDVAGVFTGIAGTETVNAAQLDGDGYYEFFAIGTDNFDNVAPTSPVDQATTVDVTLPESTVDQVALGARQDFTFFDVPYTTDDVAHANGFKTGLTTIRLFYSKTSATGPFTEYTTGGPWNAGDTITFDTADTGVGNPSGPGTYWLYTLVTDVATNEELAPGTADAVTDVPMGSAVNNWRAYETDK